MSVEKQLLILQKEIPTVHKSSTNPHFKSSYASLPSIIEVIRPYLVNLGLTVHHSQDNAHILEGFVGVKTTLTHADSKTELSTTLFARPPKGLDPQSLGGAITYLSRYGMTSLLGIATDDDDGNEASAPASLTDQIKIAATRNGWTGQDVIKLVTQELKKAHLDACSPDDLTRVMKCVSNYKPKDILK